MNRLAPSSRTNRDDPDNPHSLHRYDHLRELYDLPDYEFRNASNSFQESFPNSDARHFHQYMTNAEEAYRVEWRLNPRRPITPPPPIRPSNNAVRYQGPDRTTPFLDTAMDTRPFPPPPVLSESIFRPKDPPPPQSERSFLAEDTYVPLPSPLRRPMSPSRPHTSLFRRPTSSSRESHNSNASSDTLPAVDSDGMRRGTDGYRELPTTRRRRNGSSLPSNADLDDEEAASLHFPPSDPPPPYSSLPIQQQQSSRLTGLLSIQTRNMRDEADALSRQANRGVPTRRTPSTPHRVGGRDIRDELVHAAEQQDIALLEEQLASLEAGQAGTNWKSLTQR